MSIGITSPGNRIIGYNGISRDFQSFKSDPQGYNSRPMPVNPYNPASIPASEIQLDKKSTGPIQGTKNIIAGLQKAWVTVSEYTKGTVSGAVGGAALGLATFGAFWGRNLVKAGIKIKNITPSKPKKAGLVVSSGVALATLGYNLFKASLNVSERKAAIDHRYNTGHRFEA